MAYSRALLPAQSPPHDVLTSAMEGIGMAFAAPPPTEEPNVEDTLLFASLEAMEHHDLRVLAVLVTWFGVHSPYVNADRLTKIVAAQRSERVLVLWSALARWMGKDRRFARLAKIYKGPRIDLLPTGTDFQVNRHGEDTRFAGSELRAPANLLRDREADVLSPRELARRHRVYRHRVMIGPTYRADMWAALDVHPDLTTANLARLTYGSFATAWNVRRDHHIARAEHT
jgi:hypothetical protein